MFIDDVKEIISKEEYEFYGIRIDSCNRYSAGDICKNSHQWWQDDPEDGSEYNEENHLWDGGELGGTCCLKVSAGNAAEIIAAAEKSYFGSHVTLIAGDYAEGGYDSGELVIENAKVLYVIK